MQNKYEHLENNCTAIFFNNQINNQEKIFFIDTDCFEIANLKDCYWIEHLNNTKSSRMPYNIIGKLKTQTQKVQLSRLILNCKDSSEIVYNISGNHLDLRKCNLLKLQIGENHKTEFKQRIKNLKDSIPSLPQLGLNFEHPVKPVNAKKNLTIINSQNNNRRLLTDEQKDTYIIFQDGTIKAELERSDVLFLFEQFGGTIKK